MAMNKYSLRQYLSESTDYAENVFCVYNETKDIIEYAPEFIFPVNEDGEDDHDQEPESYIVYGDKEGDIVAEFKTFDEMSDWLKNKADELKCVEKSKLNCLYRNARRRLKKELYNYVKRNAECMGWSIGDFISQCLLAVTNYEVSIDEVMERELMFAV
jgi:hypothetical protein